MASTTGFEIDNQGSYIRKDPASVLDYKIDWTNWLGTDSGASVVNTITSDSETTPTLVFDTTISGSAANQLTGSGKIANIYLSGGTAGVVYTVSSVLTTSDSRKVKRSFRVKCETVFL
tara:strand:- start:1175 stop:1528 length:354 start_codon:yes stop_codon:yes gene_type:complete